MHFVQWEFLALFALVFCVYWTIKNTRAQNLLLLAASCVFYGWVHPWFLCLLFFSAGLDYSMARLMDSAPAKRRLWLTLSMIGNLGMLGMFKYYDFFVAEFSRALMAFGMQPHLPVLNLALPIGISFYTFQTMSYTIDVYRGTLAPRKNLLDVMVYVSFFPQLVAGPIERASHFLPQVEAPRVFRRDKIISGASLMLWGYFKKICIADAIAPYVNEIHMLREPSQALVWAAVVGFGLQILADFSAYTDIARGCARMFGFELVHNFKRPYLAASTPEFWRRWHISLSEWIGDYVYTPLTRGGRAGGVRIAAALMLTFFLIGLWHGATVNFIVLGLWHGLWMVFYTFMIPLIPRKLRKNKPLWLLALIFHMVVVIMPGGLLFRERDILRVWQHMQQPFFGAMLEEYVAAWIVVVMTTVLAIPMMLSHPVESKLVPWLKERKMLAPAATTWWTAELIAIFIMFRNVSADFIYFEF